MIESIPTLIFILQGLLAADPDPGGMVPPLRDLPALRAPRTARANETDILTGPRGGRYWLTPSGAHGRLMAGTPPRLS